MNEFTAVLQDFEADLSRADDLLALVKAFREFAGADVPPEVTRGAVFWPEALRLAGLTPAVRTDMPVLAGSILLYACGRFESFARDLLVCLADDMAVHALAYGDLPNSTRMALLDQTLAIAQSPGRFGYDEQSAAALLVSLASNLDGKGGSVSIASDILSITENNMNSRMLAELFKRVDIVDLWRDLGKQAPLKLHLSSVTDKECTLEAQRRLDSIMKERNKFAHPTNQVTFPDPDQVLETTSFLKVLCKVLVDVVQIPRNGSAT